MEGFTAIANIGKINNRLVVDGRMYGGIAQGIGLALSEDFEDIEKDTTMLACGIPYPHDVPDKFDLYYVETRARARPVWRQRRGRSAADVVARSGDQRHKSTRRACASRIYQRPEKILAGLKAQTGVVPA